MLCFFTHPSFLVICLSISSPNSPSLSPPLKNPSAPDIEPLEIFIPSSFLSLEPKRHIYEAPCCSLPPNFCNPQRQNHYKAEITQRYNHAWEVGPVFLCLLCFSGIFLFTDLELHLALSACAIQLGSSDINRIEKSKKNLSTLSKIFLLPTCGPLIPLHVFSDFILILDT